MNKIFQGKITVRQGKIIDFAEAGNFVQIETFNESYHFDNAYALPGFTDSHGHISGFGSKLNGLDLSNCLSAEECVEAAINNPKLRGDWIVGFGWNNELWKNNEFPDCKILDKYFPKTPVFLTRIDGHAVWVNSQALKIAGLAQFTANPEGGFIMKDKSGNLTGILLDNAIDLIKDLIPKYSDIQISENIITALNELAINGITSVHDMDVHPELLQIYRKLDAEMKLPIRIYSFVSGHKNEWLKHYIKPEFNNFFNVIGVKFYADGSLGSRTAAMLEDYSDKTGEKGIFLTSEEELHKKAKEALSMGFHVATHAIGDAANRMVIRIYNKILAQNSIDSNLKLRVEHAQHIHPDDQKLLVDSRIIASIQPIHCISDAETISEKRLGERCSYAYPWKSLFDIGARIISGSDFPIESHNPFIGIDALTKRIPYGRTLPWFDKEILDIDTAVNTYIHNPHGATNSDSKFGEIQKGFLADFVLLDKDIFTYPKTREIKVLATFVNGKRVF